MGNRDIFPHDDHPVRLRTRDRLIGELGDRFRLQAQVFERARADDGLFHVRGPLPRLGLHLVGGAPHQAGPRARGQRVGFADEIRARIVPEDEPHAIGVPPIQMLRLRKIRIAAET